MNKFYGVLMIVAGLGGLIWSELAQFIMMFVFLGGIGLLSSSYVEESPQLQKVSSYFERNGTPIALSLLFIFGLAILVLDYLNGIPLSQMFGQY